MLVDVHCHADEYSIHRLREFIYKFKMIIVGVSVDLKSSLKILEYSKELNNFIPCVGLHPWYVDKLSEDGIDEVFRLSRNIKCIGEVGLDTRFVPKTIEKQRDIFRKFLEIGSEEDTVFNLHSVDTWREVLELLRRYDISKAIFHWYTGPINLLKDINDAGYFISINPSVKFQKKHKKVLEKAPIEMILTESDGPYLYKGYNLSPEMISESIDIIAEIKGLERKEAVEIVYRNFEKIFDI